MARYFTNLKRPMRCSVAIAAYLIMLNVTAKSRECFNLM